MSPRSRLIVPLLSLLMLAVPASVQAGSFGVTPAPTAHTFQLGTGQHPDVSVDSIGTAHVVWGESSGNFDIPDPLRYCQILRGASSCSGSKTLDPPLSSIGRSSYVFTP